MLIFGNYLAIKFRAFLKIAKLRTIKFNELALAARLNSLAEAV